MKRRLFPILSAVSLGLCVIWLVLWLFSNVSPWEHRFVFDGPHGPNGELLNCDYCIWDVRSVRGSLLISAARMPISLDAAYWKMFVVCLVLPVRHFVRAWRLIAKARRIGHCAVCGYDLRATPARCPECGAVTGA